MHNILIVDDDPFFLEMLQASLLSYNVITAINHQAAIKVLNDMTVSLVILDIQLGASDGYSVCREIREKNSDIPILFMSGRNDLQSRLKAYDQGGNDYIAKPYQKEELEHKLKQLIGNHKREQILNGQLSDTTSLVNNIQKEAAHLQAVNRFIQSSMHCKDIETLTQLFGITLKELNTSGVLMFKNGDNSSITSFDGAASRLEKDILMMSENVRRIHNFGKDRALFNWDKAIFLVRDLDSLVDILAILMDALEMILTSIEAEKELVEEITSLEHANLECHDQIEDLISDMTLSLQDSLITLGLVSDLDEQEEEMIKGVVVDYSTQIKEKLTTQSAHSQQIKLLVNQLRKPSDKIQEILAQASAENNEEGCVELF